LGVPFLSKPISKQILLEKIEELKSAMPPYFIVNQKKSS
jgi:hypothetical protein